MTGIKGKIDLTRMIGWAALTQMDTSPYVALGSVAPPARTDPPIVQPAQKPRRQNASATRMVYGSKYPGGLLREMSKQKGVGRPPKPKTE